MAGTLKPLDWMSCRVTGVTQETPKVRLLKIEIPDSVPFDFLCGQFIMLQFPDEPKITRAYSIASSPLDKGYIEIALNKVGHFTSRLFELQPGETLLLRGPFGKFVYKPELVPHAVLIAGGTGITPYRSFLRYHRQKKLSQKITLVSSAQTPAEIVFREEFESIAQADPKVKLYFTVTRPQLIPRGSSWSGLTERINTGILKSIVPDFNEAYYYLCGSNQMIDDLSSSLRQTGVSESRILYEKWGDF